MPLSPLSARSSNEDAHCTCDFPRVCLSEEKVTDSLTFLDILVRKETFSFLSPRKFCLCHPITSREREREREKEKIKQFWGGRVSHQQHNHKTYEISAEKTTFSAEAANFTQCIRGFIKATEIVAISFGLCLRMRRQIRGASK